MTAPQIAPCILLVAPRDSYRTAPYIAAARRLGLQLVIASEGRQALNLPEVPGIQIDLHKPADALRTLLDVARTKIFHGVIGTDDGTTELAVDVARALGLPHNPLTAVRLARRKDLARDHLAAAGGLRVPDHWRVNLSQPLGPQIERVGFPCVVKPVALSASRGVIRCNDRSELTTAVQRVGAMLANEPDRVERESLLIESYIPGDEFAVEGLLRDGQFEMLALFDKPEPLEGPYFEESYYITPSRLPRTDQAAIASTVAAACAVYGLREGPVHAECRMNADGVWILEVAARTIGGLCGRLLRFGTGYGLEELVLQHSLGRCVAVQAETGSAGVLMIPIPEGGILRRVEGLLAAQRIPHIEEVVIDVREGNELVPLPEGSSYLGFIFARAPTPGETEAALRAAHACLRIVVAPFWKGVVTSTAIS